MAATSRRPRRRRRRRRAAIPRDLFHRHRHALQLRERGELEAWQALTLVVWPPAGSRLENATYVRGWSEEVKAEAVRLYAQGLSLPAVASELGLGEGTIKPWLAEAGVGRNGRQPTVTVSTRATPIAS